MCYPRPHEGWVWLEIFLIGYLRQITSVFLARRLQMKSKLFSGRLPICEALWLCWQLIKEKWHLRKGWLLDLSMVDHPLTIFSVDHSSYHVSFFCNDYILALSFEHLYLCFTMTEFRSFFWTLVLIFCNDQVLVFLLNIYVHILFTSN